MGFNAAEIYKSDSEYLKAEDIGTAMPTVTIQDVELKDFGNGDQKLVLYFIGKEKCLPLNKTNAGTMQALYGDNTDLWMNRPVMLFTMHVDFNGKKTLAIRLRAPAGHTRPNPNAPTNQQQEAPPVQSETDYGADMSDEIPF